MKTKKNASTLIVVKNVSKPIKETTLFQSAKNLKLTIQSWMNPLTGKIVGYQRAYNLGLVFKADSIHGILNPSSRRIIGFNRAKQLGLLKDSMFNRKALVTA